MINQDCELDAFKREIDLRQFAEVSAIKSTGARVGGAARCCGVAPTRSLSSAMAMVITFSSRCGMTMTTVP